MQQILDANIFIKLIIFVAIWFLAIAAGCIDISNQGGASWRIPLPRFLKIVFFGWFTYFDKYDVTGIIVQISNYTYFVIYIIGGVIGIQNYYNDSILLLPFIIMAIGYSIYFIYDVIRAIIRRIMRFKKMADYRDYIKKKPNYVTFNYNNRIKKKE